MEQIEQFVSRSSYTIASQIAFYRKRRGMTQEQLAKAANMTQETVARLEQTDDIHWTFTTLSKLAAALDVRVHADMIPNT